MMYYSTEQLWCNEWENGGPYYENPQGHEKFNPVNQVAKWHTPMLVIHGEQYFRIPYDQGIAAFTALQRRGIESRLLIFPNENHWVLQPADSVQWYQNVLAWLDQHLKHRVIRRRATDGGSDRTDRPDGSPQGDRIYPRAARKSRTRSNSTRL